MTQYDFQTKAHAKWILAGEHAVLRDSPALVFPVPNKYICLFYQASDSELSADFSAPYGETLLLFFWGLLEKGFQLLNLPQSSLKGKFFLENNIPMGAGMGFSAALCVSVARWFAFQQWITAEKLFDFARELENSFHGKSSGVDIAGVLNNQGMRFKRGAPAEKLSVNWSPKLYLSSSDAVSVTAKCVKIVEEFVIAHPNEALKIDQAMEKSVNLAEKSLQLDEKEGFPLLVESMQIARNCFQQWGLIKGNVEQHIQALMDAGAVVAKPTGAGSGGYVLSLWDRKPPGDLAFELEICM